MKVFAYEGAWHLDQIVIVGCGGTGSALIRLAARILWHRQQMGQSVPALRLVDPDVIEHRNVLRQGFSVAEVGGYKSEVLALRYGLAYGLEIEYVKEAFDADRHVSSGAIVVDCTDNHLARREIVRGIERHNAVCISNGNGDIFGQTTIGGCGDLDKMREAIERMESGEDRLRHGVFLPCYHLPHFGLVFPELLEPEPPETESEPMAGCEFAGVLGGQHLLINENIAQTAAIYLYKLLSREPITTFITRIDIHNQTTTSTLISPMALREALNL